MYADVEAELEQMFPEMADEFGSSSGTGESEGTWSEGTWSGGGKGSGEGSSGQKDDVLPQKTAMLALQTMPTPCSFRMWRLGFKKKVAALTYDPEATFKWPF